MTELRPADAEAVIVGALSEVLTGATVGAVALHRDRMVVVDVGAGTRTAHVIDVWPVAIQTYAADHPAAAALCGEALAALLNQAGYEHPSGAFIFAVTNPGLPVQFLDPDAREPRYQVTAEVGITQPDEEETS